MSCERRISGTSRCSTMLVISSSTDRKSTRLNSSHTVTSYAVFCLKKKTRAAGGDPPAARHRPGARQSRAQLPNAARLPLQRVLGRLHRPHGKARRLGRVHLPVGGGWSASHEEDRRKTTAAMT